jgi:hypothetical protein
VTFVNWTSFCLKSFGDPNFFVNLRKPSLHPKLRETYSKKYIEIKKSAKKNSYIKKKMRALFFLMKHYKITKDNGNTHVKHKHKHKILSIIFPFFGINKIFLPFNIYHFSFKPTIKQLIQANADFRLTIYFKRIF